MMQDTYTYTWLVRDSSLRLVCECEAASMRSAVINARRFLKEFCGEGEIAYYKSGELVRIEERTKRTRYRFRNTTDY